MRDEEAVLNQICAVICWMQDRKAVLNQICAVIGWMQDEEAVLNQICAVIGWMQDEEAVLNQIGASSNEGGSSATEAVSFSIAMILCKIKICVDFCKATD